MSARPVDYPRDRLYEEVWAEPLDDVAARHGLSGVTLAKICRRLNVPLPGRGYWAKKRAGKSVPVPKLPPLADAPREQAPSTPSNAVSPSEPESPSDAEERDLRELHEALANYRLARDIRAYVAETRQLVEDAQLEISKGGELHRHLEFAIAHADRVDPLGSLRREIAKIEAESLRPDPPSRRSSSKR